jgi:hypothetical protein
MQISGRGPSGESRRRTVWSIASALAIALGILLTWWQSDVGFLFCKGRAYGWLASESLERGDEARARRCLVDLLEVKPGVSIAEAAVQDRSDPRSRIALWRMLESLAPNDEWRARFRRHLEAEANLLLRAPFEDRDERPES